MKHLYIFGVIAIIMSVLAGCGYEKSVKPENGKEPVTVFEQSKQPDFEKSMVISDGINSNDYSNLPAKSVESLNKIAKFTRKYDCIATFKLDNRSLSSITKETIINKIDYGVFEGETILYGKLTDIGGEKPNLHLKINEENKVIIDISEEVAQKLSKNRDLVENQIKTKRIPTMIFDGKKHEGLYKAS